MQLRVLIPFLATFGLVSACASTGTTAGQAADRECFNIQTINNWSVLDNKHLYIKASGADNHFLLTMFASCHGIRSAQVLAFSNHTNRICSNDFGSVTYRDAGMPQRCRINNIERVSSRDEAKQLVEAKKSAKDDDPDKE